MNQISNALRPYCSFILAVNIFFSLMIMVPLEDIFPAKIQEEGISSATVRSEYPKHLDAIYYRLGSVIITIAAFFFMRFIVKDKPRYQIPLWLIGIAWLFANFYFVT